MFVRTLLQVLISYRAALFYGMIDDPHICIQHAYGKTSKFMHVVVSPLVDFTDIRLGEEDVTASTI